MCYLLHIVKWKIIETFVMFFYTQGNLKWSYMFSSGKQNAFYFETIFVAVTDILILSLMTIEKKLQLNY